MDIMPTKTLPPVAIRKLSFKHPPSFQNSNDIFSNIAQNVFKQTESVKESLRDPFGKKIKASLSVISGFRLYMLYLSRRVLSRFTEVTDTFLEPSLEGEFQRVVHVDEEEGEGEEIDDEENVDIDGQGQRETNDEDDDENTPLNITRAPGTEDKKEVMMIFIKADCAFPQVFVVSSGFAWRNIKEEYWDSDFQQIIAKRVLEFKVKDMTTHNLTGSAITKATSYRPGQEDQPTLWSFLGSIMVSYTMPLREGCALYQLQCFLKADGSPKKINTTVGKNYIKFKTKLNLECLAALLDKLLLILQDGFSGFDDRRFSVFDHVKIVKDKNLIGRHNQKLEEMLKNSELNGLHLYHKGWSEATSVSLYVKGQAHRLVKVHTWTDSPPLLDEVLKIIPGLNLSNIHSSYLEVTYGQMGRPRQPLLTFVEGHVLTHSGMSVFRHEGKWMQISCEYMVELEEEFSRIERENTAQRDILPLPWVYSGKDDIVPTPAPSNEWQRGWPSPCHLKVNHLFHRAYGRQTEGQYNEGYILFDTIIRSRYPGTGYLLGDRILVKSVELFDILHYTPHKTYLIHVKEGFGNTTRDVCSQIRVSAELLFRNLVSNSSFDILKLFLESARKKLFLSSEYGQIAVQRFQKIRDSDFIQLFQGKEIVFVLAYRDTKQESTQIPGEENVDLYPPVSTMFNEIIVGILIMTSYLEKSDWGIKITNKVYLSRSQAKDDMKESIRRIFSQYLQALQMGSMADLQIPETVRKVLVHHDLISCHGSFVQLKALNPLTDVANEIVKTLIPELMTAFSLLKGILSRHESILAKLEVVQLFNHFKKFATSAVKFELEICSISKKEPGWSTNA